MNKIYHFEIPLKNGGIYKGEGFLFIEECVEECKKMCKSFDVDYNDREVKFVWECTEEGEFAG